MEELIKNGFELYEYFMDCSRPEVNNRVSAIPYDGVMVKTKVRSEIMTNERQGKITIKGTVKQIVFDNLGGGVWRARLKRRDEV